MLGVGAALGRVFTPDDDQIPRRRSLAVISYRYWVSRFAGEPDVMEKILVNGYPLTIIGVSQAGFDGTDPGSSPQIRVPVMMKPRWTRSARISLQLHIAARPLGQRLRADEARRDMEQAKAALQPFFHQMLEMEVQQKEFARAAPETKQRFPDDVAGLVARIEGRSELRDQFRARCWC